MYRISPGKIAHQQKSSEGSGALPALVVAQVHQSHFSSIKGRTSASARPSGMKKHPQVPEEKMLQRSSLLVRRTYV